MMRLANNWSALRTGALLMVMVAAVLAFGRIARADIIDDWSTATAPAPPALKPVAADPKTTALLVLDFLNANCSTRPACQTAVPKVSALLAAARAAHVLVVYSEFPPNTVANFLPALAPQAGDANVVAQADKFIGTNLDQILKDHGIKTVIVTGTSANGAAMFTASDAAFRGYKVVFPVDGAPAQTPYAAQLATFEMSTLPGEADNVTLTRCSMVTF